MTSFVHKITTSWKSIQRPI